MKPLTLTLTLTAVSALLPFVAAANTVIDFESISLSSDCDQFGSSVKTQGFQIAQGQGSDGLFVCDGTNTGVGSNGTQSLLDNSTPGGSPGGHVVITETSGQAFDLISFDASEAFSQSSELDRNAVDIGLHGNQVGGGVVQTSFTFDGTIDGPGGSADFETFTLPNTWTNLTSVHIAWLNSTSFNEQYAFIIDNIDVHVVPEPSRLAMLLSGLLGLLSVPRRR